MKWFALLVCAFAACATTDDRPETLAYINETILAPSCGTTLCHSAMKRAGEETYAFDTLDNTRAAFQKSKGNRGTQLIVTCELLMPPQQSPCEQSIQDSYLMKVMTIGDADGNRMPFDQPLPSKDLVFIADWIRNGADGYDP